MNILRPSTWFKGTLANRDTGNPVDAMPERPGMPVAQLTPTRNVTIYALGNPLLNLTPATAADMLNRTWYGEWTRAQWVMMWAEKIDPDVMAVTERLTSALRTMDHGVTVHAQKDKALADMAEKQRAALEARYAKITGINSAIAHLALAKLRSFAHVGIDGDDLKCYRQVNVVRHGDQGAWLWNPNCQITNFNDPSLQPMRDEDFIIRVHERPALWISLIKFLRTNYSQKWWDSFCEKVSKQGVVLTAPEGISGNETMMQNFAASAAGISQGGPGALPWGSKIDLTDAKRGPIPFREHMEWLRESFWLAVTGQTMTSLSQPTGIGAGSTDAHADTFATLAAAEGECISELFQEKIDKPFLDATFPGQPHLAFWRLNRDTKPSASEILDDLVKAKAAGFVLDAAEASERTGYNLTLPESAPVNDPDPMDDPEDDPAAPEDDEGGDDGDVDDLKNGAPSGHEFYGNQWTEDGGGGGEAKAPDEIHRRMKSIDAWAAKTGETDAKIHAHVARHMLKHGASLKDAVKKAYARRDKQRLNAFGKDLYDQMKAEGKFRDVGLMNRATEGTAKSLGVPASWLAPVRDMLAEVLAKAEDSTLSDADLVEFANRAAKRCPELFHQMDHGALAEVFEKGMGAVTLETVKGRIAEKLKAGGKGA